MTSKKNIAISIIVLVVGVAVVLGLSRLNAQEKPLRQSGEISFPTLANLSGCELPPDSDASAAKYDSFAKCLTEKGVKMYGAYWCGHCANQKKAFGESFKYVNYIECADENNRNIQLEVCVKAGIEGYPTWEFPAPAK